MSSRLAFGELLGSALNILANAKCPRCEAWPDHDHADENSMITTGAVDPRLARSARVNTEESYNDGATFPFGPYHPPRRQQRAIANPIADEDSNEPASATFRPYGLPPQPLTTTHLPLPFSSPDQEINIHEDERLPFEEEHRIYYQAFIERNGFGLSPPTRSEIIKDIENIFDDVDWQLGSPGGLHLTRRIFRKMNSTMEFLDHIRRIEDMEVWEIDSVDYLLDLVREGAPWYDDGIPSSHTRTKSGRKFAMWRWKQLLRADLEWLVGDRGTATDIYEQVRMEWSLRNKKDANWLLNDKDSYDDLRSLMFYFRESSGMEINNTTWRKLRPNVAFVESLMDVSVQGG